MDLRGVWGSVIRCGLSLSSLKAMVRYRSAAHLSHSSVTSRLPGIMLFVAMVGSSERGKRTCSELTYHLFHLCPINQSRYYGQPGNSEAEKNTPLIWVLGPNSKCVCEVGGGGFSTQSSNAVDTSWVS